MKIIIDVPEEDLTEEEVQNCIDVVEDHFADFEIIKGNTNGDMIKAVFPKAHIEEDREDTECVFTNINHGITFDVDWWDEPCRKEQR